jgi:ribosomal-protein-alanine N-acetyltransferase
MSIADAFARFPTLTTERLILRQIQPEDTDALFAIYSDAEAMRYYGHTLHLTPADTRNYIARIHANYAEGASITWGVTMQGVDQVIGTCGFHHFADDYARAETGYALHPAYWGKGVMVEAMQAVLTYGFSDLSFHRVEAIIDIANEASKRLLLKLGFTYEGNLRQRYRIADRFEDEHYFGLLRDEWQRR